MAIKLKPSALEKTRWYDYLIRFAFGGAVTCGAGVLGHFYGPLLGGLFLAFPALLPASLTLVKEHDGRAKAADDAAGATCGALGLAAFAGCVYFCSDRINVGLALTAATVLWFLVSFLGWWLLESIKRR